MAKQNKKNKNKQKAVNASIIAGDKYNPTRLNAHYRGEHYYTQEYKIKQSSQGFGIATKDANKFVNELLAKKRQPNNLYQVMYKTASGLMISSKFDAKETVPDFERYGLEEGDFYGKTSGDFTITNIIINSILKPKTKGGAIPLAVGLRRGLPPLYDDVNNDCLYDAVKFGLSDKATDTLMRKPWTWKEWVKIGRKDPIDYTDIPIIEDKLKCRINIVGDYEYHSVKPYSLVVQVELKDGHYKFKNNMAVRNHFITKKNDRTKYKDIERNLVYFETSNSACGRGVEKGVTPSVEKGVNPLMRFYNGIEITEKRMNRGELNKSKTIIYREHSSGCIESEYNNFMKDCNHFKELTTHDLKDYGYAITDLCLALFYKKALCYDFEEMDEFETAIHLKCRRGGLMYADNTVEGEMNCFDINSSYPSVMIENSYPYTKPEYSIITERSKFGWGIGLYHAKIHDIDRRLMTISETDWYSSVDMKRADELGYTIELIQDGEFNALQYNKRITGTNLFGGYINDMFIHKNTINPLTGKKNPIFKSVLNNLHGLLAQRDKKYYTNDDKSEPFETFEPRYTEIYERDGDMVVKTKSNAFMRPHARLLTFITAFARTKISKLVEPIKEDVFRIQTDSFMTNIDEIKTDNSLGGLKKEFEGSYSIEHVNKIICVLCGKTAKCCSVLGCC
jgi:hypothetical protein